MALVIPWSNIKIISKTGIYVIFANALTATEEAKKYAHQHKMSFSYRADPEEFIPGSEVALT